jgi:ubiquinone/menaquinone biosynthesis C-methylase UbiE
MREAWRQQATNWLAMVEAKLDRGWDFSHPRLLELLPPAGRLTLDVGCGEGRLGRVLQNLGHRVIAIDIIEELAHAAATKPPGLRVAVADAAHLPLSDGAADLVVAYYSLLDTDDYVGAIAEAARVLEPGGRFCFVTVHPIAESGAFVDDGSFRIDRSYLETWRYPDHRSWDGVEITYHSEHRPLETYSKALEAAGFTIEAIREPSPNAAEIEVDPTRDRWQRIPNVLMVRARRQ